MKKKIYIESLFLITLGMLTSLSLPPLNFLIINFFTFTLFFLFLIKKKNQIDNKRLFFFYGWLFGFGYFLTNLYWISISLSFDRNFEYLIPISIFLIPAFLAIFYGLASYLFVIFKTKKIIVSFLVFSLTFGIIEFLRGTIFTGFPWNLIAFSFSNQKEILSVISLFGTYGFNLFCISLFTSPAIFFVRDSRKDMILCIFFIIAIVTFYLSGISYKKEFNNSQKNILDYKVRIIGSQISLDRFYSNIEPISVIKELIELSNPDLNDKIIFIWPEGILPGLSQKELIEYNWLFSENFNENHIFIIGVNSHSIKDKFKRYHNTLTVYDNKLKVIDYYNKIKLVPFGEFLPFEKFLRLMGLRSITNNYQSFSSGEKRNIIKIKKQNFSLHILPLICYEIIYSGNLSKNFEFDVIVNISEDGWFGQSIGPKQHFAHSVFRAIESGKYILRSSNNGIAAVINPLGFVEKKVKFGESGYIDLKETQMIKSTIFSKYGNKMFGLLILLYILLIFSFNKMYNE